MSKVFPVEQLKPVRALMSAKLNPFYDYDEAAQDPDNEDSPLYYRLIIMLEAGHVPGDEEDNNRKEIDLDNLILHITDWRTLDQHPLTVTDDNVEGVVYLFGVHNPVEISAIEFSERDGNRFMMDATLDIDFDHTDEGYQNARLELRDVPVSFSGLLFYLELLPHEKPDPEEARTFAGQFVPLEAYEHKPTFDEEFVHFAPKTT